MHIVLGDIGQLEVDHVRQLVDIQPACRDVGGHEHADVTLLEAGQRPGACALALVAVDRRGTQAGLVEILRQTVGTVLGTREHQHLSPVARADQPGQKFCLASAVHAVDPLRNTLGGRVAARHFDRHRRIQQPFGQGADLAREGRRKQQVLPTCRQLRQHLADVVDEAHVEHAIGLVEYQDLDPRKIQSAL